MNMTSNVPPAIAQIAPDGNLSAHQKRRFILQMALRRINPGTGSSAQLMKERTTMQAWPDLRKILEGLDWLVIGGVATRAYMPERMTKDLDILVRKIDGNTVMERLNKAGYALVSQLAIAGFAMRSPAGVDVDVLLGEDPWLDEAFAASTADLAGYPVISLPFLVILKLTANRLRDMGDLSTILGWAEETDLAAVRKTVARHLPAEREDLESIIYLGQQERKSAWNS